MTKRELIAALADAGDLDGEVEICVEEAYYEIKLVGQVSCTDPIMTVIEAGDCVAA